MQINNLEMGNRALNFGAYRVRLNGQNSQPKTQEVPAEGDSFFADADECSGRVQIRLGRQAPKPIEDPNNPEYADQEPCVGIQVWSPTTNRHACTTKPCDKDRVSRELQEAAQVLY